MLLIKLYSWKINWFKFIVPTFQCVVGNTTATNPNDTIANRFEYNYCIARILITSLLTGKNISHLFSIDVHTTRITFGTTRNYRRNRKRSNAIIDINSSTIGRRHNWDTDRSSIAFIDQCIVWTTQWCKRVKLWFNTKIRIFRLRFSKFPCIFCCCWHPPVSMVHIKANSKYAKVRSPHKHRRQRPAII